MIKYLTYDVNFEELSFTGDGNDLIIKCKSTDTTDRIKNILAESSFLLCIKTADGFINYTSPSDIVFNVYAEPDENGNYSAVGSVIHDNLIGTANNDTITSGKGDDFIWGLGGADTFVFNKGDGKDIINDADKEDCIHINIALGGLKYLRSDDDLVISYTDDDNITLSNFFKNKPSDNIDMIKNLDGATQAEYEDYINNPPVEYVYYHGYPEEIRYFKLFMSEEGYELCEKSILQNANIYIGEKKSYTGTDYNETVVATGQNGKFNLGIGNDSIEYSDGFKKSTVTINKGEVLNLKFGEDTEIDYKISGNNLVLTTSNSDVLTLKNYLSVNKSATLKINGTDINSVPEYLNILKADSDNFVKGKYTGTVLADNINASEYKSKNNKTGVTIKSKSGNDQVVGSNYNDTIKVSSLADDRTTVTENAGKNTITTGKGRDTINLYNDSSNTVKAGNGKNIVTISSTGTNKYTGGVDRDIVTVTSGTNTINVKGGYNTVNISGGKNTVESGNDHDEISISAGVNSIKTADGFDKVTLMGGVNTVNTGKGNDTIVVTGGTAVLDGGVGDDTYDFMDYYNYSTHNFEGHIDITDTKGKNTLMFYDQMVITEPPVKTEDGIMQLARLSGTPHIFFDVSINKKGQTVIGKDFLFTNSNEFSGFDGVGIHVTGQDSISQVEAVHLAALYYGTYSSGWVNPYDPEEPYERPNYGKFASARYSLDYTELAEKVSAWLTSESNTSGYKSAMEVFTKGDDNLVAELTAIYTASSDSCYKNLRG